MKSMLGRAIPFLFTIAVLGSIWVAASHAQQA